MRNKSDPATPKADYYKKRRLTLVKEIDRMNYKITRKIEELTEVIVLECEAKKKNL